jgi:class 3 adenylate cyclase
LIGTNRLRYAIFGDAVNTAQRLESGGEPGEITVSEAAVKILENCHEFALSERAAVPAKGKGMLPAWVLEAAD